MIGSIQGEQAAVLRLQSFPIADQTPRELARLNAAAYTVVEAEGSPRGYIVTQPSSGIVGPTPKAGFILNAYA